MPIRAENRSRYPRDWPLRSRFVRFVRARGRCEWCGAPNYAVVEIAPFGDLWWSMVAGPFNRYADARQAAADAYVSRHGIEGDEKNEFIVVVLTTAHVHDDRPEAASLLNLAALCQRCHNRHDMPSRRAGIRDRRRSHTADLFA